MKKILALSILALLSLSACGDDTTNATNNNVAANNTESDVDPVWFLNIDGQDEVSGATTSLVRFGEKKIMVQFASTAGSGQITIDDLAADGLGTYAETVSTQLTGFVGAPNCGFTSNGDGTTPPLEIVITKNDELTFHATFKITDMNCSMLTGGGAAPNINGTGEITKN